MVPTEMPSPTSAHFAGAPEAPKPQPEDQEMFDIPGPET